MGAKGSKVKGSKKKFSKEDIKELATHTHFTAEQISKLYSHFKGVSNSDDHNYKINLHEFQTALQLPSTDFTERIFAAFDTDDSSEIEFDEFVLGLSALTPDATIEEKATFCFGVYDIDGNGHIEKGELKQILTFSLGSNSSVHLSEQQIDAVVEATFKQMDTDNNGGISLQEFIQAAKQNPSILSCVNLNLESLFK